jgi:hypothetical protein
VLKNCAPGRDPALGGFCKCSHIAEYAALSRTPHALAGGRVLVFNAQLGIQGYYGIVFKKGWFCYDKDRLEKQKQGWKGSRHAHLRI